MDKRYRFIMIDGSRYTVEVPYADVASFLTGCACEIQRKTFIAVEGAYLNLENVVAIEEL